MRSTNKLSLRGAEPHLRPALESDFDFTFEAKRQAMGPHIRVRWEWDEQFQLKLHRQRWTELPWQIIEVAKTAVGTVAISRHQNYIQFGEFYLLCANQRLGIGSSILKSVLKEADSKGIPIRLEYLKWNPVGTLYRRNGFREIGADEHRYFMLRQPEATS